MTDDASISVGTASEYARENPADASAAIQTLFAYVEKWDDVKCCDVTVRWLRDVRQWPSTVRRTGSSEHSK